MNKLLFTEELDEAMKTTIVPGDLLCVRVYAEVSEQRVHPNHCAYGIHYF